MPPTDTQPRPRIKDCREFTDGLHADYPDLDAPTLVDALRAAGGEVSEFQADMLGRELRRRVRIENGDLREPGQPVAR